MRHFDGMSDAELEAYDRCRNARRAALEARIQEQRERPIPPHLAALGAVRIPRDGWHGKFINCHDDPDRYLGPPIRWYIAIPEDALPQALGPGAPAS